MWTERRSGHTLQRSERDHRSPFERDKTRVIHCPAFRRLQRKTQILGTVEGDFHRTRLTHSLEVASIGVSIVRHLQAKTSLNPEIINTLPSDDLISSICLLHDIGHPPFGHGGETALNFMMRNHGGFEGNGQTLRLLTKIESSYGPFGLDLTRRVLLGILKYPAPYSKVCAKYTTTIDTNLTTWRPPKAYFDCEQSEIDWLLSPLSHEERVIFQSLAQQPTSEKHGKTQYYSLDCSIMNIADDIAYGVHDLEDAIHLKLIHRDELDLTAMRAALKQTPLPNPERLIDALFHIDLHQRKEAIGELVNYFVTAVELIPSNPLFKSPVLSHIAALEPAAAELLDLMVDLVYQLVIDSPEARTAEYGGQTIIKHLFTALSSNPSSLLDSPNRKLYTSAPNENAAYRVLCDYIANMTDDYAYRLNERLFGFNHRAIFERT